MTDATPWRLRKYHRDWLMAEANRIFDMYQFNAVNPKGGFFDLDKAGKPHGDLRQIHATCRMVHCFAIAHVMGRPGADLIIDHGLQYLWNMHRDQKFGGYLWSLDDKGPRDDSKQAYGHAFVLLAASAAKVTGHPQADKLMADINEVIETRFWDEKHGAVAEEFARDWSKISDYRGQNSNMHLTESLMAAFEATSDAAYLRKAERIADLIINRYARSLDFAVAEHFDTAWNVDKGYKGSDMFRPAGTTPGHWLEWSRLTMQLWVLGGKKIAWLPEASKKLFLAACERGWDPKHGGYFYTLGLDGKPLLRHKIWWPMTEAIAAAAFIAEHDADPFFEEWYRRVWSFAMAHFIDHDHGNWFPELDDDLRPFDLFFTGKPDIYHSVQACLIPLFPATGSITKVAVESL